MMSKKNHTPIDHSLFAALLLGFVPLLFVGMLTLTPDRADNTLQAQVAAFPDVAPGSLVEQAASRLKARGIIDGFPDGTLRPYEPVNRAQNAKIMLNAAGLAVRDLTNEGYFTDIINGEWYVDDALTAAGYGIVEGYPDYSFRPEGQISTAEFLAMITRALLLETNLPYTYTDVAQGEWFAQYAGIAREYDMFPSRDGQNLLPHQLLTRGEVIIAVDRALNRGVDPEVALRPAAGEEPAASSQPTVVAPQASSAPRIVAPPSASLPSGIIQPSSFPRPTGTRQSTSSEAPNVASSQPQTIASSSRASIAAASSVMSAQSSVIIAGSSQLSLPASSVPTSQGISKGMPTASSVHSVASSVTQSLPPYNPNTVARNPSYCNGVHIFYGGNPSEDGRFASFVTDADNLSTPNTTEPRALNEFGGGFLKDMVTGELTRIGIGVQDAMAMTPNASHIAYMTLRDDPNGTTCSGITGSCGWDEGTLIIYNRLTGVRTTADLSSLPSKIQEIMSETASIGPGMTITADGTKVTFGYRAGINVNAVIVYEVNTRRAFVAKQPRNFYTDLFTRPNDWIPTLLSNGDTLYRDSLTGGYGIVMDSNQMGIVTGAATGVHPSCRWTRLSRNRQFATCETYEALVPEDQDNNLSGYFFDLRTSNNPPRLLAVRPDGMIATCSWDNGEGSLYQGGEFEDDGPPYRPNCGNDIHEQGERCDGTPNCSEMCLEIACGNRVCESGENRYNCHQDCWNQWEF